MEKKNLKVTTKQQFVTMFSWMQQNPDVASGKRHSGSNKAHLRALWETLVLELNSIGPPIRTVSEWQRVWIHFKANLKRKLANNKRHAEASGVGRTTEISLTSLEKIAIDLLQLGTFVNPSGKTFGNTTPIPNSSENSYDNDLSTEHINLNAESSAVDAPTMFLPEEYPTYSGAKNVNSIEDVELEADDIVTMNNSDILATLKRIEENTYKGYEIQKQMYDLKRRKLELHEKQSRQADEMHNMNMKIKEKELQLLQIQLNDFE